MRGVPSFPRSHSHQVLCLGFEASSKWSLRTVIGAAQMLRDAWRISQALPPKPCRSRKDLGQKVVTGPWHVHPFIRINVSFFSFSFPLQFGVQKQHLPILHVFTIILLISQRYLWLLTFLPTPVTSTFSSVLVRGSHMCKCPVAGGSMKERPREEIAQWLPQGKLSSVC